jgi:signal transduction histidine kinase
LPDPETPKAQELERERESAERTRQAEKLTALGTLTAGLAHEIRNPLNAAHLQLTVAIRRLAEAVPEVPAARQALALVDGELQRLAALLDDFLAFATPQPLHRETSDLRAIAEQAIAAEAGCAATTGNALELVPGAPVLASVDPAKLRAAVRNLIRNGIEASGSGGHVRVRLTAAPDHVLVEVEDDGPGLPAAQQRVFEPFFTTKNMGTGLGLSIVHRVATDHDGQVWPSRRDGHTVFTIRLPR